MNRDEFALLWKGMDSRAECPLRVTGHSMRPLLLHGRDMVHIRKYCGEPLRKGDIVLFRRSGGGYVLHRIIRMLRDGRLLMNGDAQVWTETIWPVQIEAVVVGIRRNGKRIAVDCPGYRAAAQLWMRLRALRPFLFRWSRRFHRLCTKG